MKKTTSIKLHPDTVDAVLAENPPSLSEGIERALRRAYNLPPKPHGKPGNPNFGPGYGRGRGAKGPTGAQDEGTGAHPDNLPAIVPPSPCGDHVACEACILADDCIPPCGDIGRSCATCDLANDCQLKGGSK